MNATSASLLALLDACGGELTGGQLVRTAQERIGEFWTITRSQAYRELAALEAEGLVAPGAAGARDARPVRITPSGQQAYRRWLAEDLPGETIRIPLLLAVGFGRALPPGHLAALLDAEEARHRARLEHYREVDAHLAAAGVDAFSRSTLAFGLHYEEAVLRWFASLPAEVRRA